jgi:alkanesulfonate monooxygenase SsuD/methylene tetrahydromethanopterin reductase-like flavin-dependent oxidoreductase (luciferase family)
VATIQELSAGRLRLGVGVGWMEPEFRALGVDPRRRGAITDETLVFLDRCFASDVVEANGQPFLFRPRPPRPPIFIGGKPPLAFRRALRHRAGWLPIGLPPDALAPLAARLRAAASAESLPAPEVAIMTTLPLDDRGAAKDLVARYAEAGAGRVVHGARYADLAGFLRMLDGVVALA